MKNNLLLILVVLLAASCTRKYYIVRHAEKAAESNVSMMSSDPPLSEKGQARAMALKESLKNAGIGYIFSTNTVRTKATAEPTRIFFDLQTQLYAPQPTDSFINNLKTLKKNVLIVGHSNTVDDIVNKLCGSVKIPNDLDESKYDNLYIIRKKGRKMTFENEKYGELTP